MKRTRNGSKPARVRRGRPTAAQIARAAALVLPPPPPGTFKSAGHQPVAPTQAQNIECMLLSLREAIDELYPRAI